jgi:hypothetical protein
VIASRSLVTCLLIIGALIVTKCNAAPLSAVDIELDGEPTLDKAVGSATKLFKPLLDRSNCCFPVEGSRHCQMLSSDVSFTM